MTARQPIAEGLISCRNILQNGISNEHVLPCLENVLMALGSITIPSTKKIIQRCVAEVINQVKNADFLSAGLILNLIHNLPLNEESERQWDIDYFLSIELYEFLERFEEINSARLIALFVCKQVACKYLPNSD